MKCYKCDKPVIGIRNGYIFVCEEHLNEIDVKAWIGMIVILLIIVGIMYSYFYV